MTNLLASCVLDASRDCIFVPRGTFYDKSGKVGAVSVSVCRACGHAISTPKIDDIAALYDDRTSQDYQPDARGLSHWIKSLAFGIQAKRLLGQLAGRPRKFLDFGCGSGQFTRILGDRLGKDVVIGSDLHDVPPAQLQDRRYLTLSELGRHEGRFDLVMAMHVLEHDDDANALLARLTALTEPGGAVLAEVPNVDCVWTRVFGPAWDGWYLPYHRQHFSRQSFRALFQRAGLEIVSEHDVTVPTMGRSIANLFRRPNSLPWLLVGIALHPVQWLGERLTGRPSALRIIARKPARR